MGGGEVWGEGRGNEERGQGRWVGVEGRWGVGGGCRITGGWVVAGGVEGGWVKERRVEREG